MAIILAPLFLPPSKHYFSGVLILYESISQKTELKFDPSLLITICVHNYATHFIGMHACKKAKISLRVRTFQAVLCCNQRSVDYNWSGSVPKIMNNIKFCPRYAYAYSKISSMHEYVLECKKYDITLIPFNCFFFCMFLCDDKTIVISLFQHWECKLLVTIYLYTIAASLMWIFMEGLYLHMLVYKTLFTERHGIRFYVLLGWGMWSLMIIYMFCVKF